MNKEEKLIYFCIHPESHNFTSEIKSLLFSNLNWFNILYLCRYHEVNNLLYYKLRKMQYLSYIPQNVSEILKSHYENTRIKNMLRCEEISNLIDKLKNINLLLYKGIILSNTVYEDIELREFSDIDVLAKEKDVNYIREIMINDGYKEKKQKNSYLFIKLLRKDVYCFVELHTQIVPERPYKIEMPLIWQRAQKLSFYGRIINYPSKEDMFVILALHIRRHTRRLALKFICDIANIINLYKDKMDWDYIYDLSKKNHIKNTIYFSFYIIKELFCFDLPYEIINRFRPYFLTRKFIHICMNKNNFLNPYIWQGYILRLFLFDNFFDFLLYLYKK